MSPRLVGILVGAVLYLILVAQNTEVATFKFFFWEVTMPRVILLTLMALLGFVVGLLSGGVIRSGRSG